MKDRILWTERRQASTMIRVKGRAIPKFVRGEDTTEVFMKLLNDTSGFALKKEEVVSAWRQRSNKTNIIIVRYT